MTQSAATGHWAQYQYASDPVASYADMVMYYTKKMLTTFADGIYYDNAFVATNYVPAPAGPAYVNDDGKLVPGVGLWAMRDFMRRSAVLQHTLGPEGKAFNPGNPTVLYNHMTNVNVIPWLSWASINLDWESHDHNGLEHEDYQTRFGVGCDEHGQQCNDTSLIMAESMGLQAGNIPTVLDESKADPKCGSRPDLDENSCMAWLARTQWATCIPHEIRPWSSSDTRNASARIPASPDGEYEATPLVGSVAGLLESYGYGDPTCDVYRFWEEGFPVETSGPRVLSLVIRCPVLDHARVLVFFGSFGPRGNVTFSLNQTALGLNPLAVAFDAETGDRVHRADASAELSFAFRLDRHNFKLVAVE